MATVTEDWSAGTTGWKFYKGKRDNELQLHVDSGCHNISNHILKLSAKRDASGQWTSPLLSSKLLVPPHGKLIIPVKAPWVKGIWPAVWLLGGGFPPPIKWPLCGELDILEVPGNKTLSTTDPRPLLHGNVHGVTNDGKHWQSARRTAFEPNKWMTIGVDFTKPNRVDWLVNGRVTATWDQSSVPQGVSNPLPESGMTLILSIAVGGWAGPPDTTTPSEVSMEIGTITWSI